MKDIKFKEELHMPFNKKWDFKKYFKKTGWIILGIIILLIINPFYIVDQTDVAVVKTFGKFTSIQDAGLHFKIPMIQKMDKYYIGTTTIDFVEDYQTNNKFNQYMPISVLSSDGLVVIMDISIQARLRRDKIETMAKTFSGFDDLDSWRIAVIRGSIRDVIAIHKADAIYGEERTKVEIQISEKIREKLGEYYDIDAVYMRKITLPSNLQAAIELKLQSQQEAMKMEYVLQREKLEAERKAVEAKGISDYNAIISKNLNDKYLQWYYVQSIDKLSNSANSKVVIMPVSSSNIPGFNSMILNS